MKSFVPIHLRNYDWYDCEVSSKADIKYIQITKRNNNT